MSFSAEIKEFLGAAKETYKLMSDVESKGVTDKYHQALTEKTIKETNDPLADEERQAKIEHMRKSTANIGRESPLDALKRQYWQQKLDAEKNPPPDPALGYTPSGGRVQQAPVPGGPVPAPNPADEVQKTGLNGARGGLIQKFAVGGLVDDSDLEDDDDDDEGMPAVGPAPVTRGVTPPAAPAVGPSPAVGTSDTTDISARARNASDMDAVSAGLKRNVAQMQPGALPTAAYQRALSGYVRGAGAAPVTDMRQIYKKIDPKGEMGESERNLAAIGSVYRYKMSQGDQKGAADMAGAMLQNYKTAATRYAAIAKAALDGGNVDAGMKAILKTYANIPDGNDMKLWQDKKGTINYTITDPDGAERSAGIVTPEQLADQALEVGTKGIEPYLLNAAGVQYAKRQAGGGGISAKQSQATGQADTPKPGEYKELKQGQTDQHVDDWYAAYLKSPEFKANGSKEMTPKELASTKNMLYHVRRNNDVTDDEGLRRIQTIISAPEPTKKGEIPAFRASEDKENKTWNIQFPDGGELTIPSTQIGMFKSARVENLQTKAAEAKAAADKANRQSGLAMAGKAVEDFTQGQSERALALDEAAKKKVGQYAEEFPTVAKNVREGVEGIKYGAGEIGRVAGEAGDWLRKYNQQESVNSAIDTTRGAVGRAGTAASEALKGGAGHLVGRAIGNALTGPATAAPVDTTEDRPL
jgi:hypothetical protein